MSKWIRASSLTILGLGSFFMIAENGIALRLGQQKMAWTWFLARNCGHLWLWGAYVLVAALGWTYLAPRFSWRLPATFCMLGIAGFGLIELINASVIHDFAVSDLPEFLLTGTGIALVAFMIALMLRGLTEAVSRREF